MTNFHASTYRAADIYPQAIDELYADLTADHAGMTAGELQHRIERCRIIASDALTYGLNRAAAAKRIGEHAASVLSQRKVMAS